MIDRLFAYLQAKPGQMEAELSNGLIMGHAYSITGVKLVSIIKDRLLLVLRYYVTHIYRL